MPKVIKATPAEKRELIYDQAREAFRKVQEGEALTAKEARILEKTHRTFRELEAIFNPSIKQVIKQQGRKIAKLLEAAEIEDEE